MMCDNCGWSRAENKCDNCEQMQLARQLIRERDTAFARGTEAMREAAASCAGERARYWVETSTAEGGVTTMEDRAEEARYIADDIRALPIPDDKSSEG